MTDSPAPQDFPQHYYAAGGGALPSNPDADAVPAWLLSGGPGGADGIQLLRGVTWPDNPYLPPRLGLTEVSSIANDWLSELGISGSASLQAAAAEFIAAWVEYSIAQLSSLLWVDASIVIHESCCLRRIATAAAWLESEFESYSTAALFDANYDDATIAELLGGIQG